MSLSVDGRKRRLAASPYAFLFRRFRRQVAPDGVSSAVLNHAGIAAVENVEVSGNPRWPNISAFVVLAPDTPDCDGVVRRAAESLHKELQACEVTLGYVDTSGRCRGVSIVTCP